MGYLAYHRSAPTSRRILQRPHWALPDAAETTLFCEGICCASEEPVVHKALRLRGVVEVEVQVVTRTVKVRHDAQQGDPQPRRVSLGLYEITFAPSPRSPPHHPIL